MIGFWFCRMIFVLHLLLGLHTFSRAQLDDDLKGDYCRRRYPQTCCPGRDDTCTVPILGSVCYCDIFCGRTDGSDCCPDFWSVCGQSPRPPPRPPLEQSTLAPCYHGTIPYNFTETLKKNCNTCTCVPKQNNPNKGEFKCEEKVCLIIPESVNAINAAVDLGWQAENYPNFYGKTLQEGIAQRLGTFKPTEPTVRMTEIRTITNGPLPEFFDTRERWRGLIQPVKDQGDCASSWAFSTTALASDRLAIESLGTERIELSPQQLLSCQNRGQRACEGGHLDKAWYYLRKTGVTTESCYPYSSGQNGKKLQCPFKIPVGSGLKNIRCPNGAEGMLYHSTPPYRVGPKEEQIMREIYYNGPVQATFRVHEDFFSYKSGVYRYSRTAASLPEAYRQQGWHSVRILGWGTENINGQPVKYWICANSWGSWWGEDGYFRVVRGENECDIEMFIIGVWANLDDHIV